jgi:5-carboxymethyl-2-hydroxymuconate isomerase
MAHFIYEYSANLPEDALDLPGLMAKMHAVAADTGVFPLSGMRSRAIRCEEFRVADGAPEKGFINLSMKVGHGRDEQTRLDCGQMLFDTMIAHLQPLLARQPVAVSFEMRELEELVKFNRKSF